MNLNFKYLYVKDKRDSSKTKLSGTFQNKSYAKVV